MQIIRSSRSVFAMAIAIGLVILGGLVSPGNHRIWAGAAGPADTRPIIDQEYARNGTFSLGTASWYDKAWYVDLDTSGGKEGPGLRLRGAVIATPEYYVYTLNQLNLPDQVTAATFSLDYRIEPYNDQADFSYFRAYLYAFDAAGKGEFLVMALTLTSMPTSTDWQVLTYTLTADDLATVNAAHAAGKRVLIAVDMKSKFISAYIDNVSFRISGQNTYPDLDGTIAFIGRNDAGAIQEIALMEPDAGNRRAVWTNPDPRYDVIFDLDWKPDAGELAFTSDHENIYSVYHADVYGIKPDGSGLRRITSPPSRADIVAGSYQKGTVSGKIHNNSSIYNIVPMGVYVQGAPDVYWLPLAPQPGQTVSFSVPDVADLGAGVFQYIQIIWAQINYDCVGGKEYELMIDVQPGQNLDVDTLTFNGFCNEPYAKDVSWKRDGSQVGFILEGALGTAYTASVNGQLWGTRLFTATQGVADLAWSPVDDRIVYKRWTFVSDPPNGLYLTTEGNDAGTLLASEGNTLYIENPAWLPDGTGFVYTHGSDLYHYNLSGGQATRLTNFYNEYAAHPSLSPDGRYVAFERLITKTSPDLRDLWILDLSRPVKMWPISDKGRSGHPAWSRVKVQSPTPTPTATNAPNPTPTATPTDAPTPTPTATPIATSPPNLDKALYLPTVLRQ